MGSGSVTTRPPEGARGQEREVPRLGGTVLPSGTSLPVSLGPGSSLPPSTAAQLSPRGGRGQGKEEVLLHVSSRKLIPVARARCEWKGGEKEGSQGQRDETQTQSRGQRKGERERGRDGKMETRRDREMSGGPKQWGIAKEMQRDRKGEAQERTGDSGDVGIQKAKKAEIQRDTGEESDRGMEGDSEREPQGGQGEGQSPGQA